MSGVPPPLYRRLFTFIVLSGVCCFGPWVSIRDRQKSYFALVSSCLFFLPSQTGTDNNKSEKNNNKTISLKRSFWRERENSGDMAVVNGLQAATGTQLENLINKCEWMIRYLRPDDSCSSTVCYFFRFPFTPSLSCWAVWVDHPPLHLLLFDHVGMPIRKIQSGERKVLTTGGRGGYDGEKHAAMANLSSLFSWIKKVTVRIVVRWKLV